MSNYTSIHPYRGGKSSRLNRIYRFYGTKWMLDMFWDDQELDHIFFHIVCVWMLQEMVTLSVTECQKHWNFMTKTS